MKQKSAMIEALFIDNIFQTQTEKFDKEKLWFFDKVHTHMDESFEEHVDEFVELFFDERSKEDIDFDYLIKVVPATEKLEEEIKTLVNSFTQSFKYDDMDTIDQSLFLLGYAEFKILWTPKEVIINELIELAKRYSDDWSPKLLNGIMHKMLTPQ